MVNADHHLGRRIDMTDEQIIALAKNNFNEGYRVGTSEMVNAMLPQIEYYKNKADDEWVSFALNEFRKFMLAKQLELLEQLKGE